MSFVDLMGNTTYTPEQINKRLHNIERGRYSERQEGVLNRIASGISLGIYNASAEEMQELTDFNTFMAEMIVEAAGSRADNQLLIDTLEYESATRRLDQYTLLLGRAEQLYVAPTYDEFGVELTPEVPYIAPIDPLPEFVDGWDNTDPMNPIPIQVRNPLVVADEAERAAAQAVVTGVSVTIMDLADLRGNIQWQY